MYAKTDGTWKLKGGSKTASVARAPLGFDIRNGATPLTVDAALHGAAVETRTIKSDLAASPSTFKMTPYSADLHPASRDVAKDIDDADGIPLLTKTQLENDFLHGDRLTLSGRMITEVVKSETWTPHQVEVRQSQRPLHRTRGVGLKGKLAPEGADVKVAGMSYLKYSEPVRRSGGESVIGATPDEQVDVLHGGHGSADVANVGALDVYLTDNDRKARTSEWMSGATDHLSDVLWNDAQQVRSAIRGTAVGPGGAAEKHCYANV